MLISTMRELMSIVFAVQIKRNVEMGFGFFQDKTFRIAFVVIHIHFALTSQARELL